MAPAQDVLFDVVAKHLKSLIDTVGSVRLAEEGCEGFADMSEMEAPASFERIKDEDIHIGKGIVVIIYGRNCISVTVQPRKILGLLKSLRKCESCEMHYHDLAMLRDM